jgi:hypothetical protein
VPGSDAAEEEVASYLAHVGVCPFHAAVEQREEALLLGIVTLAGRDLSAPGAEARAGAVEGGDRLDAEAKSHSRSSGRSQPAAAPGRMRAQRVSAAQRPSDEPAPALRRLPARRLAVALCALAAVVLLALVLYRPTEQRVSVVQQGQPSRPPAPDVPPPPPTPEATPSANDTQNRQDVVPATPPHGHAPTPNATPRVSQGGGRVSPPPQTREQLTVADVRRIYVGAGEGAHDPRLREALIERLRASDRFIVVGGEQQADAVLLREQSRGAGVTVQLVTRGGKTLWFTTQTTGAGGAEDVGDLAARIVNELTAAADKRRPPVNAPRR